MFLPKIKYTGMSETQSNCVDLVLYGSKSNEQVYWSPQYNSYVVNDNPMGLWSASDGTPCDLLSINGHGEIRWAVTSPNGGTAGDIDAARYFGLSWHGYRGE